eukprot:3199020-Alexandrium_andersonii.AAC.1
MERTRASKTLNFGEFLDPGALNRPILCHCSRRFRIRPRNRDPGKHVPGSSPERVFRQVLKAAKSCTQLSSCSQRLSAKGARGCCKSERVLVVRAREHGL